MSREPTHISETPLREPTPRPELTPLREPIPMREPMPTPSPLTDMETPPPPLEDESRRSTTEHQSSPEYLPSEEREAESPGALIGKLRLSEGDSGP